MSEWQTIDSAPRDGSDILVCDVDFDSSLMRVVNWNDERRSFCANVYSFTALEPTHWQPLPEPPVDNDKAS